MFKKFLKKNNDFILEIPLSGDMKPISEAPDPVFAQKMMGDGFCIDPSVGELYSPVNGEVVTVFPTKHCFGIRAEEGHEILIHFGMDTVKLNGEGFELHVNEGDVVKAGQLLLNVDIEGLPADLKKKIDKAISETQRDMM